MPRGWICPRLFEQRLIVPRTNTINAGKIGRHFSNPPVEYELLHLFVGLPEIDDLIEYFSEVVCIFVYSVIFAGLDCGAGYLYSRTVLGGSKNCLSPDLKLARIKEVHDCHKAILPIGSNFLLAQRVTHCFLLCL